MVWKHVTRLSDSGLKESDPNTRLTDQVSDRGICAFSIGAVEARYQDVFESRRKQLAEKGIHLPCRCPLCHRGRGSPREMRGKKVLYVRAAKRASSPLSKSASR